MIGILYVLSALARLLPWPFRGMRDAVELRVLQRQLPNAHRWLVTDHHRTRPETDSLYLERLRRMARDRFGE